MPSQVKVGLILTIVGYVGLIVSMWLKLEGAVAAAAPLMSAGGVLLGKEWFPQSEHAQKVYSKRPPPPSVVGIVFALIAVVGILVAPGCGSMPAPNDAAAEAAKMRAQLAEVKGALDFAEPAIEMLCAIRPVEQCGAARIALRTLQGAHSVATSAVNTAESLGVALGSSEVENVAEQSKALGAAVLALGQEVARVASQGPDRVAPAEPSRQPGAAAPAASEVAAPPDASGARP